MTISAIYGTGVYGDSIYNAYGIDGNVGVFNVVGRASTPVVSRYTSLGVDNLSITDYNLNTYRVFQADSGTYTTNTFQLNPFRVFSLEPANYSVVGYQLNPFRLFLLNSADYSITDYFVDPQYYETPTLNPKLVARVLPESREILIRKQDTNLTEKILPESRSILMRE